MDDLRYAARTLRKSPGFTAVALLTLALAIGATTSVFTVVNAVLLRELPYKNASRLVLLWSTQQRQGALRDRSQVNFPNVEDWRKLNHSFEDIAAYAAWDEVVTGHGEAERISTLRVSPSFFGVMGAQPLLGRTFVANENLNAKASVAVLSYGLWQRKFARDPNILGKTFSLNSTTFTIIGVMPQDFRSLPVSLVDAPVELYQPLSKGYLDEIPSGNHLRAIGRLKPGVTLESAQAELNVIARQLELQYPDYNTGRGVRLVKLQDDLVRNLRTGLLVLQIAVCLVVLIACANLANLPLSRSTVRRKEIAIRAAVGAGRARLMRQMLTESLLLGALGGAAGLLLAIWGVHVLEAIGTKVIPELTDVTIDLRVLGFTAAIPLLSGTVFGMAPAAQISIGSLANALRAGGRSAPDTAGPENFSRRSGGFRNGARARVAHLGRSPDEQLPASPRSPSGLRRNQCPDCRHLHAGCKVCARRSARQVHARSAGRAPPLARSSLRQRRQRASGIIQLQPDEHGHPRPRFSACRQAKPGSIRRHAGLFPGTEYPAHPRPAIFRTGRQTSSERGSHQPDRGAPALARPESHRR
jgi:putative ABC transport system permease protein